MLRATRRTRASGPDARALAALDPSPLPCAGAQVAFADRLIVNKIDLATDEDVLRVETRLREINKFAPMIRCKNAAVQMDQARPRARSTLTPSPHGSSSPSAPSPRPHPTP
eukprot:3837050-Prymnesium_polylepis.1